MKGRVCVARSIRSAAVRAGSGLAATIVALLFLALTLSTQPAQAAYSDVPAANPFAEGIGILSGRGILTGFADGSFRPYDPVTRQQLAKVVVLATGLHTPEVRLPSDPGAAVFPDVSPALGVPYPYDYIEESASLGYFRGDDRGRFDPRGNVTRLQLALVLVRAAGDRLRPFPGAHPTPASGFTDVPAWAEDALALARRWGLVEGKTQTLFDPWSPASRGQVAKMVARLPMVSDPFLGTFRLDFVQEGVRIEVSGLRERTVPVAGVPVGSRVILGEVVMENRGDATFRYDAARFRLILVPDLMGPGERILLESAAVGGLPFLGAGDLAPGETIHGYLLTWVAPGGTQTKGLQVYDHVIEIAVD